MARIGGPCYALMPPVVQETRALLPVIDAAIVAPYADGTLLVVGQAQVREQDLKSVLRQLALRQIDLVGVVVNQTSRRKYYSYY